MVTFFICQLCVVGKNLKQVQIFNRAYWLKIINKPKYPRFFAFFFYSTIAFDRISHD